ncbi:MAG: hypothetical protein ACKPFD_10220 [Dolichospermum sp.]
MSNQFEWQFDFRNFNKNEMQVRVRHTSCALISQEHRNCTYWQYQVPYCPTGRAEGLYKPANYVVDFNRWWPVIKNGLKLIGDLGIFFVVESPKSDDLIETISHVFGVDEDVVEACLKKMSKEEIEKILHSCHKSVDKTCIDNLMNPTVIRQMAKDMNLNPQSWGIISGKTYRDYIWNSNSPIINNHGWSVFRSWGDKAKHRLLIAESCFIHKGRLIYPCDDTDYPKHGNTFWNFWSRDFNSDQFFQDRGMNS